MRVAAALVLLAGALAPAAGSAQSCGGGAPDAARPELREVRFEGNRRFPDRTLQREIASASTSWARRVLRVVGTRRCLDRAELPRDVARLLLFYRRNGYPRVEVTTRVDPRPAHGARLTFAIREGPPIRIDTLAIVGAPPGTPLDTGPRLPAAVDSGRAGRTLAAGPLDSAARALRLRLQNRGYYAATVTTEAIVDSAAHRARVTLLATPGPSVRVGDVRVNVTPYPEKDQRVSDGALRRMTGLAPGAPLRARDLETARRNLLASEVYRQVVVRADSVRDVDGEAVADIDVAAAESYASDVELRAAWATLDCVRLQTTLHRTAFAHPSGQVLVTGRVSKLGIGSPLDFAPWLCAPPARADPFSAYLNYYFGATYTYPGRGARPVRRSASLFTERRSEYLAYVRTTYVGTSLTASRPLGTHRWVGSLGYELTYGRTRAEPAVLCGVFSACLPEDRAALGETRRLGVVSGVLSRDGTGEPSNPRRGSVLRFELRGASRWWLSDPAWTFLGARADGSYYWPMGRDVVGAVRLRLAAVWPGPGEGPADVPVEERLYAGGATTVRGFQQNELGPQIYLPDSLTTVVQRGDTLFRSDPRTTDATTTPSGGNALVVASAELRVRSPVLPTLLQFAAFVDAGALANRGGASTGGAKLRFTPGIGLRAFTPVGAARLDIGYNPYDPPAGPAYYDVPLGYQTAPLYCVSPGNRLPVTGFGQVDAEGNPIPPVQAEGTCPQTFRPEPPSSFLRRLTVHFSFGQAF